MPPKLTHQLITIQILVSIYSYFQPPQGYNVDHIMLWAAFTLAIFGFLRASEFTCNSSSFDPTVHLCLRNITFIPNIESPNQMLFPLSNPKLTPFAKAHHLYLFCDGYERLPATMQTSCYTPFVYLHQWQVALPCLPD